jgi:hypothetical protein
MASSISTVDGGPASFAPARKVSPRLIIFLVPVALLGIAAPRVLLGLVLAPFVLLAPGFLLTLIVLPSLSLPKRIGLGIGLSFLLLCYLGLVLARFRALDKLLWAILAFVLLESLACLKKIKRSWGRIVQLSKLSPLPVLKSWLRAHRKEIAVVSFLLAFSLSVLLRWQRYSILKMDSGYFFWIAKEIDSTNGTVDNCPLLDPPVGRPVGMTEQTFPLLAVLLYRGLRFMLPWVTWQHIWEYWSILLTLAFLAPIFLMGRKLRGTRFGLISAFFVCALLIHAVVSQPPGTFERVTVTNLLTAWVVYLVAGILLSRSLKECLGWGGLAAGTYALLGLSWSGWLYLAPAVLGTSVLLVLLEWNKAPMFLAGFSILLVGSTILVSLFTSPNWEGTIDLITKYLRGEEMVMGIAGPAFGAPASSLFHDIRTQLVAGPSPGILPSLATVIVMLLLVAGLASLFWESILRPLRKGHLSHSPVRTQGDSYRGWSFFVLCWFAVLLAMVWPGKGYVRFYNQWFPFMPIIMGEGYFLVEKVRLNRVFFVLGLLLLLNVVLAAPEMSRMGRAALEAVGWLEKNAPKGSTILAHWELGYYIVGLAGNAVIADPASYKTYPVPVEEENNSPVRPPPHLCRKVNGRTYSLNQFIPLENRSFGRAEDCIRWLYLDEDELLSLLHIYREYGVRIDYLVASAPSYDPIDFHARGYIRAEDILEWTSEIRPIRGGLYLSFSRENVVVQFPDLAVVPSTYGVIACRETREGRILAIGFGPPPPAENIKGLVLLSFREMGEGVIVERAALCRRHPKPLLGELLAKGAPLPSYLKLEFTSSDGLVKVLKVCLD